MDWSLVVNPQSVPQKICQVLLESVPGMQTAHRVPTKPPWKTIESRLGTMRLGHLSWINWGNPCMINFLQESAFCEWKGRTCWDVQHVSRLLSMRFFFPVDLSRELFRYIQNKKTLWTCIKNIRLPIQMYLNPYWSPTSYPKLNSRHPQWAIPRSP